MAVRMLAYHSVKFHKFRRQRTLLLPPQFVVFDEISDGTSVPPELCGIALNEAEITNLNEIVTMYLDYAERQTRRGNIMYMQDWVSRLDAFLQFNEEDILQNKGKVTAAIAKAFAESEFEKFRVLQDRTYQSDFDRLVASIEETEE